MDSFADMNRDQNAKMSNNSEETEPRDPEQEQPTESVPTRDTSEAVSGAGESPEVPDAGKAEESGTSELLKKLEEATAEISAHKERYLRTVADLENYRKRALREKEDARRQANCSLVEDLLPVLDNFKLGLKSAGSHEGGAAFAEGFRMILKQMEAALKQNGLEEINPKNELFDPNFHESMAHIPHESVQEGHIVEVHRIGYRLHDRLLRPATVVVSSGPPEQASAEATAAENKPAQEA